MQGVARHGCIMILTALLDAHAAACSYTVDNKVLRVLVAISGSANLQNINLTMCVKSLNL